MLDIVRLENLIFCPGPYRGTFKLFYDKRHLFKFIF